MSDTARKESYRLRRPGGEIDPNRVFNTPGVILATVIVTCLVFAFMIFAPARAANLIDFWAAVSPQRLMQGAEANGGFWRMIAPLVGHMFVHASLAHILFNMLWLLAIGTPVARRMGAENALHSPAAFISAVWFLLFYFLCGAAGALTYVIAHANEPSLLVGASGGVSGLLGALVRFAFNRTSLFGPEIARLSPLSDRTIWIWSAVIIIMNIAVGLFGGALAGGMNIAWEAHIGGYLFGLFAYPLFERLGRALH